MKILFSFNEPEKLFSTDWICLVPVLIQIVTLIVGRIVYERKKFFYRNLNVASILTTSLIIFVMGDLAFSAKQDPQGGLVFIFLPFWTPFIWILCFLVCSAFFYLFNDEITKERIIKFKEYGSTTFWISTGLVIFYALFWIHILVFKAI